ncbi:hypothetical protein BASA60_009322 [Batrachochytrium salamandrivorans]|nr:hypothetical protein BASA60_009322 [Batrachochytrium salamandrivorans]
MPPALPTYTANLLKYSQTNSSVASIDEIIVHHTSHRTTQLQEVEDKEDEEEDKVEPLSPYAMQPPTHTHSPHQTTAALELLQQRPSHSPFQHYQRPASSSSSPIQTLLLLQPLSYSTESKSEPKPKPEPKPEPEPKLELVSTAAIMAASACPPPMSKLRAPTITSNSSNAFDGNNHSDYNSHDNTRNGRITNQNNINDYDPDYTNGISKYSSPPPAFQPQQQQKSQSPKPQFQSHHPPISYNDNSSYTPHNGSGMPQHMRPQLQPASRPAQIPPVSNHVFAMHPNPASPLSPKHTQPIVYPQQQQMGAPNASSRGLVGKAPSTNLFRNSRSNLKADVHNAENGQPTSRFATLLNRTTGRLNKNRDRDLLNRIYGEERDLLAKKNETNHRRYHPWRFASIMCTCCLPACLLSACGMSNPLIRQAFREKLTLCILIMISMLGGGVSCCWDAAHNLLIYASL